MSVKNLLSQRALGSDLSRVDAHEIQPEEYDEIPELTEEMLENAVVTLPAGWTVTTRRSLLTNPNKKKPARAGFCTTK
ncbi:hypothetical protein SAMN05428959_101962 [Duganella sp. CF517]|uniref:hypothetical protein n=1 Tax=Duganella sp. CF517 TaxID=1881038 RepID=UPI0008AA85E4|nr:hypothetical protein [Duganella sp. CF517]SEN27308.1 hypothetical protein SAMN05428959_101962 [Duganella sp. CF517]